MTLIELVVVLGILGIMIAIAVPNFLSMRNSSSDTTAKRSLEAAQLAANWTYRDRADFSKADAVNLKTAAVVIVAPGVTPTGTSQVSVAINATSTSWYASALANGSNRCWMIRQTAGVVSYAGPSTGTCTANAAVALAAGTWRATW